MSGNATIPQAKVTSYLHFWEVKNQRVGKWFHPRLVTHALKWD